jgi:hypothetical protein
LTSEAIPLRFDCGHGGPNGVVTVTKKTEDVVADFNQRVLMSLVVEMQNLCETVERIKLQVFAMAKENDILVPSGD